MPTATSTELKSEKEKRRRGEEKQREGESERVREKGRWRGGTTLLKVLPKVCHNLTALAFQTRAFNPLTTHPILLSLNILDFHSSILLVQIFQYWTQLVSGAPWIYMS